MINFPMFVIFSSRLPFNPHQLNDFPNSLVRSRRAMDLTITPGLEPPIAVKCSIYKKNECC